MKVEIRKSFVKDSEILPALFQKQLADIIEHIERSEQIHHLHNCKKWKGSKKLPIVFG